MGVPILMFEILCAVTRLQGLPQRKLDLVEYFCGVATITQNFRLAGFCGIGYDIDKDNIHNDLCLPQGFLCALRLLQSLSARGLAWFATVCSSWVWMSRSTTGRGDNPMGFAAYRNLKTGALENSLPTLSAWQGNVQVARSALLMCFAAAVGATWILEQPVTSIMDQSRCLQHLKSLGTNFGYYSTKTWMGAFGTATSKPTYLISNKRWVKSLMRPMPEIADAERVVLKSKRADGSNAVTGIAKALKSTQAYSWSFGEAVLDGYVFHCAEESDDIVPELPIMREPTSLWDDAELDRVLTFLHGTSMEDLYRDR